MYVAQTTSIVEAPLNNATTQVRTPNGLSTYAYLRACALVLQSELSSIPLNTSITVFGFTLSTTTTMSIPSSGNFTVYLQNTTDITYLKGNNWATLLTGMTNVYASIMTIPLSSTTTSITLTLSSPFVYTGGGIYVAYDWHSVGPFSTVPATFLAESGALNPGCASANSNISAPTTLSYTPFRPSFLFGYANPYSNDIEIVGMEAPGKVNISFNTPYTVRALVRNSSNTSHNNINVSLNVNGANTFANTQIISSLAAGASSMVTFSPFNPGNLGANTLSVSVPADQNNTNNSATYSQSVTCNNWAQNPATGSYTSLAVGFGTLSGIIATPFVNPVASSLVGIRGAISNNAASIGNTVYGVLLSAAGNTLAITNQVAISTLGTFVTFTFSTPQNLSANTTYYLGLAQTANTTLGYNPAGTEASDYLPANLYYATALTGGPLTPVTQNYGYFGLEGVFMNNAGITAASSSSSICAGASVTLSAGGVSSYTWSNGSTSQSVVVSPATNTVYSVAGTNTIGCTVNTLVSIQVSPLPITIQSNTNSVCVGSPVTFTANGATSYTWASSSGAVHTSTLTDTPAQTFTYVVTGSNTSGCSNTASVSVIVNSFTSLNVPPSMDVCAGSSLIINASGAVSYTWNTGSSIVNTSSIHATPGSNSIYTISGTNPLGCIDAKQVTINVNTFTPGLTPSFSMCTGEQITLSASGGASNSYTWSTGNVGIANLTGLSPSVTTQYSVVSLGQNGCRGSNITTVTVHQTPTVTISAVKQMMCVGSSNTLTASGATSYSWSTNSTNTSIVITPTVSIPILTYSVTGSSAEGCLHIAQIDVFVSSCTGIDEMVKGNTLPYIYPNPSNGLITVSLEKTNKNTFIKIYNTLGSLIKYQEIVPGHTPIDLSNEANGIYLLYILQENKEVSVSKIIKQ